MGKHLPAPSPGSAPPAAGSLPWQRLPQSLPPPCAHLMVSVPSPQSVRALTSWCPFPLPKVSVPSPHGVRALPCPFPFLHVSTALVCSRASALQGSPSRLQHRCCFRPAEPGALERPEPAGTGQNRALQGRFAAPLTGAQARAFTHRRGGRCGVTPRMKDLCK